MTTGTKPKIAPNSKESEMMVLGCMLTNIVRRDKAVNELDSFDFYYSQHKIIFNAIKKSCLAGKPADTHLVYEDIKDEGKIQDAGGPEYIITLAQYAGTSAFLEEYIEIVKNKSKLRKIIDVSQKAEKSALENSENFSHIIETIEPLAKSKI